MQSEDRKFTRVPFNVSTELKTRDSVYISNRILNLSVGGCLLPIKSDLIPGTDCRIIIRLEGTGADISVHIKGEIVRVDSRSVAVKFILIDPDSLFHLQNIIRYNAEDPDKVEDEISKHPGLR